MGTTTDPKPADFQPRRQAVSVHEYAEAAGVSPKAVYHWVAEGLIPSRRVGRRVLIPRSEYEALDRDAV